MASPSFLLRLSPMSFISIMTIYYYLFTLCIILILSSPVTARSISTNISSLNTHTEKRQDTDTDTGTETPKFPSDIPSCPICEENYSSISGCADAAPVLANFTMVIFSPAAFVDVIECACTDTFRSVYPQCVDWYVLYMYYEFVEQYTHGGVFELVICLFVFGMCGIRLYIHPNSLLSSLLLFY